MIFSTEMAHRHLMHTPRALLSCSLSWMLAPSLFSLLRSHAGIPLYVPSTFLARRRFIGFSLAEHASARAPSNSNRFRRTNGWPGLIAFMNRWMRLPSKLPQTRPRPPRFLSSFNANAARRVVFSARFDGIVDTFIGQVATARIVSNGKKPITVIRRKNASAAKLCAIQLKSDGWFVALDSTVAVEYLFLLWRNRRIIFFYCNIIVNICCGIFTCDINVASILVTYVFFVIIFNVSLIGDI